MLIYCIGISNRKEKKIVKNRNFLSLGSKKIVVNNFS